jgi:hypothetical protein
MAQDLSLVLLSVDSAVTMGRLVLVYLYAACVCCVVFCVLTYADADPAQLE